MMSVGNVATITALKALTAPPTDVVQVVEGYASAGDGGGGTFVWESSGGAYSSGPSFTFLQNIHGDDIITRTVGSFVTDGWKKGVEVTISGTINNNGTFRVTGVTTTSLTVGGVSLTAETVTATLINFGDKGTTFAPNGASAKGWWVRQFSGALDVRWFGAKGDKVANDTAKIQAAIDASEAAGGGFVYLPHGNYLIDEPLRLTESGGGIVGDGSADTNINIGAGAFNAIEIHGPSVTPPDDINGIVVRDIKIRGEERSATPSHSAVDVLRAHRVWIENVEVTGDDGEDKANWAFENCFNFGERTWQGQVVRCYLRHAMNAGLRCANQGEIQVTGSLIFGVKYGVQLVGTGGIGINFTMNGGWVQGGMGSKEKDPVLSSPEGSNVVIDGWRQAAFIGTYMERAEVACVTIGATAQVDGVTLTGCVLNGGGGNGAVYAVKADRCEGLSVTGCWVENHDTAGLECNGTRTTRVFWVGNGGNQGTSVGTPPESGFVQSHGTNDGYFEIVGRGDGDAPTLQYRDRTAGDRCELALISDQLRFLDGGVATRASVDVANGSIAPGTQGPRVYSGTGTPEGAVAAKVGSLFMRSDGSVGTSMYIKESGSGTTGWAPK